VSPWRAKKRHRVDTDTTILSVDNIARGSASMMSGIAPYSARMHALLASVVTACVTVRRRGRQLALIALKCRPFVAGA